LSNFSEISGAAESGFAAVAPKIVGLREAKKLFVGIAGVGSICGAASAQKGFSQAHVRRFLLLMSRLPSYD
jgi:hypothetical protein